MVVKNIYDKLRANSTYNSEKINTFLINSRQDKDVHSNNF